MMGKKKRQESNEEIMVGALEKRGYLDLRVLCQIRDKAGTWRMLRAHEFTVKKIPNQGRLFSILQKVWSVFYNG